MTKFIELPVNKAILLDNMTCPYCGVELNNDNKTKEHVIGRRFVPKGKLDGQWNLILMACGECNTAKSFLENDISAITLAGRMWFDTSGYEKPALDEVRRKIKNSTSRKTGKPVERSQEELSFSASLGQGATIKVGLVAPPQFDSARAFDLACMQMMAFFYFITYEYEVKKGGYWPEGFYPVSMVPHDDWGNLLQKAFMQSVVDWEPRWIGHTAGGYFKSIIRRHPSEDCWSWALEWNNNYRLVGFFGGLEPVRTIVNSFPEPDMTTLPTGTGMTVRFRENTGLDEEKDILFVWHEKQT